MHEPFESELLAGGWQPPGRPLAEHLEALARRRWLVAATALAGLLAATGVLHVLPERYQSSALVLVEPDRLPGEVGPPTASQRARERLQTLRRLVLSRPRLEQVLTEIDVYPELPASGRLGALRSAVSVALAGEDAVTLAFVHTDPMTAQRVADRLATLLAEQASGMRPVEAGQAREFLAAQVEEARAGLEAQEARLRRFKEDNLGHLPEQQRDNLALLRRLELEQQSLESGLAAALSRRRLLAAPLPAVRPSFRSRLPALEVELARLRARYTDEHPDVRSLLARIELVREEERVRPTPPPRPGDAARRAALAEARAQVSGLRARQARLASRIDEVRARLEQAPRAEQELGVLERDYDQMRASYARLFQRLQDAVLSERQAARWRGDRFRKPDAATLPETPVWPRRGPAMGIAAVLSLLVALVAGFVVDAVDPSVRDATDLRAEVDLPILAALPRAGPWRAAASSAGARGGGHP
jgi:polysaccharide chain length determinant protein (PEP-CTERM system associated)